jgi:hypothetical protein
MHEQDHGSVFGAFVNVGNAQATNVGVMGLIRKVRQILKSFLGCAEEIFNWRELAHCGLDF